MSSTVLLFGDEDRQLLDGLTFTHEGTFSNTNIYALPFPYLVIVRFPKITDASFKTPVDLVGRAFDVIVNRRILPTFGARSQAVQYMVHDSIFVCAEAVVDKFSKTPRSLSYIVKPSPQLDLSCLCDLPEEDAAVLRELVY